MVNVDTVYQRVLALANKEQRGYITPQEFNLFANQAQMDIFEQYFYDLNQFGRAPGNDTLHSNPLDILEEKIAIFHNSREITKGYDGFNLPSDYYRLMQVRAAHSEQMHVEVEKMTHRELLVAQNSPLTKATLERPTYYLKGNRLHVSPDKVVTLHVNYIKAPKKVNWTYVVVGEKALSNPDANAGYQDFELHPSEETKLVVKILQLVGVTLKDYNLTQVAIQKEASKIQQEKQ